MPDFRDTCDTRPSYAPWVNFALGMAVMMTPWIGNVAGERRADQ